MATIKGSITIDEISILEVTSDPSASTGTIAPVGSLASINSGAGLYLKSGAADTAWTLLNTGTASGLLLNVKVFTGSTSYAKTAGTNSIEFMLIGGGGGGGGGQGASSAAGFGGGGGSGSVLYGYATAIGAGPFTYAIGGLGTGGAATGGTGNPGTSTTLTIGATTYTAPGGSGGIGQASGSAVIAIPGGVGGVISTNGLVNGAGQPGGYGMRQTGAIGVAGAGASTIYGQGGNARITAGVGNVAVGFGAGGGGGCGIGAGSTNVGGAGVGGVMIIWEFT